MWPFLLSGIWLGYPAPVYSIWPDTEYKMPNIQPPRYPVHSPMFSTSIVCNNIFRTEHNIFLKPFFWLYRAKFPKPCILKNRMIESDQIWPLTGPGTQLRNHSESCLTENLVQPFINKNDFLDAPLQRSYCSCVMWVCVQPAGTNSQTQCQYIIVGHR